MIIGLAGRAGAGKSTVAGFMKPLGFVEVALADPLKRICRDVFAFTDDQLWGSSEMRDAADIRYTRGSGEGFLTPRHALQTLGTEWGRDCYDNVWIDHAIRTAKILLSGVVDVPTYTAEKGLELRPASRSVVEPEVWSSGFNWRLRPKGVVISDVRFRNEADAILANGGQVWRIVRPYSVYPGLAGSASEHRSETELTDENFPYARHVFNDASLEYLRDLIPRVLAS